MPKLTKRAVEAIKPVDRDLFVWDDELAGFGVRVKSTGVRSYLVQYRNEQGRSRRYTIGKHGVFTVDQARKEAVQLLAAARRGIDPAGQRKAERAAPTMRDLIEKYLTDHVEVHNKPSTAREFRRLVDRHILPAMGSLKVHSVKRQDVAKLHRAMAGTPRSANQTLAVLSKMFHLAEVWGARPDNANPCRLIKKYPETKRERFLSDAELERLGAAMDQAEQEGTMYPPALHAVRLLALTGCRLGEILALRWEDVDFEQGILALPDSKTGARPHVVGEATLALLNTIPRFEDFPWVLPGRYMKGPITGSGAESAWRRLRKMASLDDARLHDLRHTVGTFAGQTGANAYLVRDKLGHKTLAMTARYVGRDNDPLRVLSDRVESRIVRAMGGNAKADVVALRPGSKPAG